MLKFNRKSMWKQFFALTALSMISSLIVGMTPGVYILWGLSLVLITLIVITDE